MVAVDNNLKICAIGPNKKFISGITYYTIYLANAFSEKYQTSVISLRNLVPKFLFPGSKRLGNSISDLDFNENIKVLNGIDWYLIPKIFSIPRFVKKNSPNIFIFQWWTSAVAHSYLVILLVIKIFFCKSKCIMTFHEIQDPLENSFFILRIYARLMGKLIFRFFDAYAIHSRHDLKLVNQKFGLAKDKLFVVEMGSFSHFKSQTTISTNQKQDICSILFFGLIRPYKGVDYLINAFNLLPKNEIDKYELIIAGEPWDYDVPAKMIWVSPYKNKITYLDRYLTDSEVNDLFVKCDVAVFPYTRASQSAAAHTAISYGKAIIVTRVGGLVEAFSGYQGALFIDPCNIDQLADAIQKSYKLKGKNFPDPHPWQKTINTYERIFKQMELRALPLK